MITMSTELNERDRAKLQELIEAEAWLKEGHGSSRLRGIAEAGLLYLSLAVYRFERLAFERPELSWKFATEKTEEIRHPQLPELQALEEARKVSTTVELRFLRRKHRHGDSCRRVFTAAYGWTWNCPGGQGAPRSGKRWDHHGPVLVDVWRGRAIIHYLEERRS